ncbi:hypothetical protein EG327_009729 [Venturia inaequalis]|uniref:Mucoidy inhibitor-like protein n=1 Tax=Venturia inaequalis TaxID=5025 RepID=A0A8H3ZHJ4_VENIN|nr:hypothetical protein EG327_009729 [Venturia inaequalis]
MAEEIPRQTFHIGDLPTKSVTLYPSRAHIVRELYDIVLQPGQNEVEITGLTPSADENSVQVDGKGSATITDMTIELVPNTESFSDSYPSDSEVSEDESDDQDSDDEIDSVKTINARIEKMEEKIEDAVERQKSAERRLKTLDNHANGITAEHWSSEQVAEALQVYDQERKKLFEINTQAVADLKDFRKAKIRMEKERVKLGKEGVKRKAKAAKEKQKVVARRFQKTQERRKEARRIKNERRKFWPSNVYRVVLRLEGAGIDTPGSSRRNSMDSITLSGLALDESDKKTPTPAVPLAGRMVTLSLSYVTNSAFWSPRYDLSISSLNKTTTIVYRAEFSNGTSETWNDAKLILSTSQTSYSGLDDKPPFLHGWQVKLGKSHEAESGGLLSTEEITGFRYQNAVMQQANKQQYGTRAHFQRPQNFQPNGNNPAAFSQTHSAPPPPLGGGLFGLANQQQGHMQIDSHMRQRSKAPAASSAFAAPQATSSGFGSIEMSKKKQGGPGGLFGGAATTSQSSSTWTPTMDLGGAENPARDENDVDFEESVWEDNGLTANYEIPGTRTLSPSSLARRHKIASLNATNIHLSYVSVPKLRAAAFLRAKVRNPSTSVTLLKGTAGVTLDGSFLGNMTLPRVSPNQVFSLPLGVDAAIHISYPKPTVHRSTQGIFNKESAHVFTRSVWLTNTKPTPVEVLVMDQVPVSQDERLRIEIAHPKGLGKEGDAVKTGQAAKEGMSGTPAASASTSWGKAVASLKKAGEVNWTVNLEKGQACLLKLEYEAKMPSAEVVVGA